LSEQPTTVLDSIPAFITRAMADWHIPGLAIAVVQANELTMLHGFGWRDREAGLPVTTDTLFPICSLTKSFTASSLAILADAGRLDWDRPVRDYVPELRLHDRDATERVTVRDLLLHRTGLPRHDWVHMAGTLDRMGQVRVLRHLEPSPDAEPLLTPGNHVSGGSCLAQRGLLLADQGMNIFLNPIGQLGHALGSFVPERGQCVFDVGRHYRVAGAYEQAVRFELLEALRQHPLAHPVHLPVQLGEPHCAVAQRDQEQDTPLARQMRKHPARLARRVEHLTACELACKMVSSGWHHPSLPQCAFLPAVGY